MRKIFYGMVSVLLVAAAKPASACFIAAQRNLDDIKYASVVVIGRIVDYKIVRRDDELSRFWRRQSAGQGVLSDYARFRVLVEETLVGKPTKTILATWDNSTFSEPRKMGAGRFLIALRDPASESPPLRAPSATVLPSPEPKSLIVLQAPCAPAFIIDATDPDVKTIRNILLLTPKDQK
jgi:hypothetical protein